MNTGGGLAEGSIAWRDLLQMMQWRSACSRVPPVRLSARDESDSTVRLSAGGLDFWWPSEFTLKDLDVVWAEVFLPFPPNGHAYEHQACNLRPGMWAIDAGACEGFFIAYALGRGCHVVAVEPVKRLSYCLKKTFASECAEGRLTVVHAMLGASAGEARIQIEHSPIGARMTDDQGTPVRVMAIDELSAFAEMPRVDFIKMDIEGAEVDALRGASAVLEQHTPALAIAAYHSPTAAKEITATINALEPRYDCWMKGTTRHRTQLVHQMVHAVRRSDVPRE